MPTLSSSSDPAAPGSSSPARASSTRVSGTLGSRSRWSAELRAVQRGLTESCESPAGTSDRVLLLSGSLHSVLTSIFLILEKVSRDGGVASRRDGGPVEPGQVRMRASSMRTHGWWYMHACARLRPLCAHPWLRVHACMFECMDARSNCPCARMQSNCPHTHTRPPTRSPWSSSRSAAACVAC